jgi:hypothetical protein
MKTSINIDNPDMLHKTARIAGIAFLIVVIGYTLTWTLVYAKLIDPENAGITAKNIITHEGLFRLGIAGDLIIAISTLILAWALFIMLKSVYRNLALLAFSFRMVEAILTILTVSFSFISLQVLSGHSSSTFLKNEELQSLAGLFLNLHTSAATIPMVFTGLGSIVFFYLLIKSGFVPRWLAGFGIFSYLSLFAFVLLKIIVVGSAVNLSNIELICYFPSVLFELTIGFWLLIKGIKVTKVPVNN